MNYLRDLVADGYVGEVLSTTVIGSAGDTWGAYSDPNSRYLLDPANGATFALTNSRCAGTLTDTTTKSTSSQAARSVALPKVRATPCISPARAADSGELVLRAVTSKPAGPAAPAGGRGTPRGLL